VVARVNGVELTQAQYREQEEAIFPYFKMHGGEIPPSARPEIHRRAMHKLILDELLYQECQRRKMAVPEAEFQKGMRDLRKGFNSPKEYKDAVTQKYGSVAAFERRIRRALLVRRLWDAEVKSKSVVTDAYLRNYYQTNQKRFVRPEAVSLQSISFLFKKDATTEQKQQARKKAEECLPKARAAKNYEEFGVLAEKVSEDEWRVMMGDHKWTHRGEVDPQFELIFSMKNGETSGVLESREGFHILRVNDHQQQRQMTFVEMHDRLRKELEMKRREERAEQFENALHKNAKIVEM
jgi:peptidyl-prolyl cis-trans isomerase C